MREHRLLRQNLPEGGANPEVAKKTAENNNNAARRGGELVKQAGDVLGSAQNMLGQSAKQQGDFLLGNLSQTIIPTAPQEASARAYLQTYFKNPNAHFARETLVAGLQLNAYAEPNDAQLEAARKIMADPNQRLTTALSAGTALGQLTGGLGLIKNLFNQIRGRKSERENFTISISTLQNDFRNTATVSLRNSTDTTPTSVGGEEFLVQPVALPSTATPDQIKSRKEAIAKILANPPANVIAGTGTEVGSVIVRPANSQTRDQVRTLLTTLAQGSPDDPAVKKKVEEEAKKKEGTDKNAKEQTEKDAKTAEIAKEAARKTNESREGANKVLNPARARIEEEDAKDPQAATALKTIQSSIEELEAALKTGAVDQINTCKAALEKAMTALEAACKDVRKTWGKNYLTNNVGATSRGTKDDCDRYNKQMGWTMMGDYMGMQYNKVKGEWQTGWWNGGDGPMDTPAGGTLFNYERYDQINSTLKNINVHHLKPPSGDGVLVDSNAATRISAREKRIEDQTAKIKASQVAEKEAGEKTDKDAAVKKGEEEKKKIEADSAPPTVESVTKAITAAMADRSKLQLGENTAFDFPLSGIQCKLDGSGLKVGGRPIQLTTPSVLGISVTLRMHALKIDGGQLKLMVNASPGGMKESVMNPGELAGVIMSLNAGTAVQKTAEGRVVTMTPGPAA